MQNAELRSFLRHAAPFVLIGLALYGGLYGASEWLISRYAKRNRFYMVKTAPEASYDYVILGASHAAVFDYRDMNARLEAMTGSKILNLSTVGGGVLVNRVLLDYFVLEHRTAAVVYVLDSFAFYSREWNEDRLQDAGLFQRAPWDPALARLLIRRPETRSMGLAYTVGFFKINNGERFAPDLHENEGARFERVYRPVDQIDRQRVAYLYPREIDASAFEGHPYLAAFEDLIRDIKSRDIRFIVIRPPMPDRVRRMIPNEDRFDAALAALLERHGVELHDFSGVNNDEALFFDTDHLNEVGVLRFFEHHLAFVLRPAGASDAGGRIERVSRRATTTEDLVRRKEE